MESRTVPAQRAALAKVSSWHLRAQVVLWKQHPLEEKDGGRQEEQVGEPGWMHVWNDYCELQGCEEQRRGKWGSQAPVILGKTKAWGLPRGGKGWVRGRTE